MIVMLRRIALSSLAFVVGGVLVYCAIMLRSDRATNELRAEKALRVLRSRVQQFADESGHVPTRFEDLQQPEIIGALRAQIDGAGCDLFWVRTDEKHGVLIAAVRSRADVSRALVAPVVAGSHVR
jgi:hypothetical protein